MLRNTRQAAHAYSTLLPPYTMRTYTAHTNQFPSSPWVGALNRYKGLSAGVQSRLDLCPQRKNERTLHSTPSTRIHQKQLFIVVFATICYALSSARTTRVTNPPAISHVTSWSQSKFCGGPVSRIPSGWCLCFT